MSLYAFSAANAAHHRRSLKQPGENGRRIEQRLQSRDQFASGRRAARSLGLEMDANVAVKDVAMAAMSRQEREDDDAAEKHA